MSARKRLHAAEDAAMQIVSPAGVMCLTCDMPSYGEVLCETCQAQLADCADWAEGHRTGGVCFPWRYDGAASSLVLRFKRQGLLLAGDLLADGIVSVLPQLPPDTVVTWVPSSPKRSRDRYIDHGRGLAERVAQRLGLPAQPLLRRTEERPTQFGLNAEARVQNVIGAFAAVGETPANVLLVDDVFTTGSTVRACAKCLKESGAGSVFAATATRVPWVEEEGETL